MADKYRPERIEIKATINHADEIEDLLKESLHNRAKMERKDEGEVVSFTFWPTKSEYFLVAVTLRGLEYKWEKQKKTI
jgi:hypothetical protein